ncbi:hypothetical protein HYH03_010852 [Edaphochlamys debaryana]|uniref:Fungal lipase-type domain-containing protein n=1 Tax=Edaphochlamys debaryana TaxID=47281 RepID=A0A836BVQ3_9CHLO|nr:hypothetical protein HYH03_010852 [Edaphochlamys debaryana]|eukprot:KAG2490690.1 hypothetical protein HYH03_010852 [Edaphochlamys debaryana]
MRAGLLTSSAHQTGELGPHPPDTKPPTLAALSPGRPPSPAAAAAAVEGGAGAAVAGPGCGGAPHGAGDNDDGGASSASASPTARPGPASAPALAATAHDVPAVHDAVRDDVVLRIEYCSEKEVKALTWLVVGVVLFGVAVTVALKLVASLESESWYVPDSDRTLFATNRIAGYICIALTAALWVLYVARGLLATARRAVWGRRRGRSFWLRLAELSVLIVRLCCWVAANDQRMLRDDCPRYERLLVGTYLIRATMDNTLLYIWLITARGSTLWRDRLHARHPPLPQRLVGAAWACLRCCLVGGRGGAAAVGQLAVLGGKGAAQEAQRAGGLAVNVLEGGGRKPGRTRAAHAATGVEEEEVEQEEVEDGDGGKAGAGGLPPAPAPAVLLEVSAGAAGNGKGQEAKASASPSPPTPVPVASPRAVSLAEGLGAAAPGVAPRPALEPGGQGDGRAAVERGRGPQECRVSPAVARAAAAAAQASPGHGWGWGVGAAASLHEVLFVDAGCFAFAAGPLAWLWAPFQLLVVATAALMARLAQQRSDPAACLQYYSTCRELTSGSFILLCLVLGAEVVYVLVYFVFCRKALSYLRSRPYIWFRQLNINLSVEVRIRGVVLLFLVANDVVQLFVDPSVDTPSGSRRCRYALDSILGVWSAQVVAVTLVVSLAWLFSPRSVGAGLPLLQATLQRFAWTEAGLPRALQRRLASLPPHTAPRNRERLEGEPMFCFETAVKLCYWCEHAYDYDEPGCTPLVPLGVLMGLYGLSQIKVMRDPESDIKAVLAWNDHRVLVCFRGTATLRAACVDISATQVAYHNRGAFDHPLAPRAAVHRGFQWSWLCNGFNRRLLSWLASYRDEHPGATILVSGHSLGGAHANLCALDLVRQEAERAEAGTGPLLPPQQLRCYTFGAPRVGNAPYAALYDKHVNETWNVINGNDVVPLSPKYVAWFSYKHPGHKVIVKRGDLIVRPTFMENSVARLPCSRSVRQHLLSSYRRSMLGVLRMQTHGKHVEGGVRGLVHMARSCHLPDLDQALADLAAEARAVAAAAVQAAERASAAAEAQDSAELPPPSSPAEGQAAAQAAERAAGEGHLQGQGQERGRGAETASSAERRAAGLGLPPPSPPGGSGSDTGHAAGTDAAAEPEPQPGPRRGPGRRRRAAGRRRPRAVPAALAAAATGAADLAARGGSAVLAALGRERSVRLLLRPEFAQLTPAAPAGPPQPPASPSAAPSRPPGGDGPGPQRPWLDNADLRSTRQALRRLALRLSLGMELFGLDTGLTDGRLADDGSGGGGGCDAGSKPQPQQPPGARPGPPELEGEQGPGPGSVGAAAGGMGGSLSVEGGRARVDARGTGEERRAVAEYLAQRGIPEADAARLVAFRDKAVRATSGAAASTSSSAPPTSTAVGVPVPFANATATATLTVTQTVVQKGAPPDKKESLVALAKKGLKLTRLAVEKLGPSLPFPGAEAANLVLAVLELVDTAVANSGDLADLRDRALAFLDILAAYQGELLALRRYKEVVGQYVEHLQLTPLLGIVAYAQAYSSRNCLARLLTAGGDAETFAQLAGRMRDLGEQVQSLLAAGSNARLQALQGAVEESRALLASAAQHQDPSAEARALVEQLDGLEAVMGDAGKLSSVMQKLDVSARVTVETVASLLQSHLDKGTQRHIVQPDLRLLWSKHFGGEAEVPWFAFWSVFPALLKDTLPDGSLVEALCGLLADGARRQALQRALEQANPETLSVWELKVSFSGDEALLPQVRRLLGDAGQDTLQRAATNAFAAAAAAGSVQGVTSATASQPAAAWPSQLPPLPPSYTGREEEAEALAAHLRQHGSLALLAPGGFGKSCPAADVAARVLCAAGAVEAGGAAVWVDLREVGSGAEVEARFCAALALKMEESDNAPRILAAVRRLGEAAGGAAGGSSPVAAVVVVDKAEDSLLQPQAAEALRGLLGKMLAEAPSVRLVITSRAPLGGDLPLQERRVGAISADAAARLLQAAVPDLTPAQAAEVAAACHCVPLVAEALAYGKLVLEDLPKLAAAAATAQGDVTSATVRLVLASLSRPQQLAAACLAVLPSAFDGEAAAAVTGLPGSQPQALLRVLYQHSVLQRADGQRHVMHMLVRQQAAELGAAMDATLRPRAEGRFVQYMLRLLRDWADMYGSAKEWRLAMAAARAQQADLGRLFELLGGMSPEHGMELNQQPASCIKARGRHEEAEPLYRQVLELRQRVLGPEHPDTVSSINNLASCIQARGRYEEAEPLYRQALELRQRVLGPEHPNTVNLINNLASCIQARGRYEEAEPLYRQALELRQRVLGPEHPDTVNLINNLASCIQARGRYEKAEPLYRQALELRQRVLGPEHPNTVNLINNLATCIQARGRYEEAEPLYRQALELRQRVLGPEHPDTVNSINNLASCIQARGS